MKPRSIATKLSLTIGLLVAASLGVVGILAVTSSRASLQQHAQAANKTAATLAARAIEEYVADSARIMNETAGGPNLGRGIGDANWVETGKVLENFLKNFSQFDYVFVLDPSGILRVRVPHAETVGQDFSFRDFYQEAMRTRRPSVSRVYLSKAAQRPQVSIAVPVLDGKEVRGVLAGALSLEAMSRFVATILPGAQGVVYVVDRSGTLVADSRGTRIDALAELSGEGAVRAGMAGHPGTMEFSDRTGKTFLAAYVPIPRLEWVVVAAQPVRVAYEAADRLRRWLASVALVLAVLSVLAGWALTRGLTRPLLRLTEATEKLGGGDFTVRIPVESRDDEVATLAASFNAMANRLEESYRKVETLNRELELRVAERTRDLEATNKELEAFTHTALRESQERFRATFEQAAVGLAHVGTDGRWLRVNQKLCDIVGYTRDELLQRTFQDITHPDHVTVDVKNVRRVLANELPSYSTAKRYIRKDGAVVWINLTTSLVRDLRGQPQYFITVVEDIDDRKRAEEALLASEGHVRQLQKMEAVGRLAGGIAHDFNNLLTIMTGRSELLLRRLAPDDAARRDLELIKKTAEAAAMLTKQLLAFSRKQMLQPKVLDLNAIVAGVAEMLQRLIGEDIELVTQLEPNLGAVRADPAQIEQIILNLAVNARDALPQGGRLVIETANLELDETFAAANPGAVSGPHVLLQVSDTGSGMSAEVQAHVFEPFFTTKEVGKGTGLGLATVYGIVKQHGGYIAVQSAPGAGTAFRIYLKRLNEIPDQAEANVAAPRGAANSEIVLLVEDEDGVRELASELLTSAGYKVLAAAGPGEALEIARRHGRPIHLLLTDVVMPQMSGRVLAKRLTPEHPEMPVLYMSGYTDDAIGHHGVLEPGTMLLQKPFTPDALTRKVREVLALTAVYGNRVR